MVWKILGSYLYIRMNHESFHGHLSSVTSIAQNVGSYIQTYYKSEYLKIMKKC